MKTQNIFREIVNTLGLENDEIIEIFENSDISYSESQVEALFLDGEDQEKFDNKILEDFLNGFIIYKRGRKEEKPGAESNKPQEIKIAKHINNVVMKKLKIALSLTNDDVVDLFEEGNVFITKGDLTPYFRKDSHKHYKRCDDTFLMNFLKGLKIFTIG